MLPRPTYLIRGDVTDIDLDLLHSDGIRGLIFDLDSTLVAPRSGRLTEDVAGWLARAKDRFKVAVVSNNARAPYLERVRNLLEMPVIGAAAKPRRRGFMEALEMFGLPAAQVAVIGDRPLTDVWGGQRAGMKTVLVWPLKSMNEPSWLTALRKLERYLLNME
jgi:uncharacterized protein